MDQPIHQTISFKLFCQALKPNFKNLETDSQTEIYKSKTIHNTSGCSNDSMVLPKETSHKNESSYIAPKSDCFGKENTVETYMKHKVLVSPQNIKNNCSNERIENSIISVKIESINKISHNDFKERLERVCMFLSLTFNGEEINLNNQNFYDFEKTLIYLILDKYIERIVFKCQNKKRKKFSNWVVNIKSHRQWSRFEELARDLFKNNSIMLKRKEEKIKFVFKHTVNAFKRRFLKERQLKVSLTSELMFLEHLFGKESVIKGFPLDSYSDPLNTNLVVNSQFKTQSREYFKRVFSAEGFKEKFFTFLQTNFKQSYKKNVAKQFRLIICNENQFNCDSLDQYREKLFKGINKISQIKVMKLPWTSLEVTNAIQCFKKEIETILNK